MDRVKRIKNKLKENLSKGRYLHCVRVAEEAKLLAHVYKEDEENAYMAGLLHDVAKEFSLEENKKWVKKYNLSSDWLNSKNIKIVHAEIGWIVAKEVYGVNEEIAQAIRYHTIGNVNMTLFDKIIFMADKIESGREDVKYLKVLAYQDVDKAMIRFLHENKIRLERKGKVFHEETERLLNRLVSNTRN
ncbi:MAG: bis(5'-nucleosyl)-tetraphosphatase (symmetrical) YqeK [Bacilli bacterium]|nr:bis(5'-nucleosyl)-tetraphosphatase (symmetrical) YqeK [Bacilli bacterium]